MQTDFKRPLPYLVGLILLLAIAAAANAADRLDLDDLSQPQAYQSLTFARLLGVHDIAALEFAVEIPAIYRERRIGTDMADNLFWATPADWSRMVRGRASSGHFGAFIAQRSPSLAFDVRRGQFGDSAGMTEAKLAERLAQHDAKSIQVRRVDRNGVPILMLEADLAKGERLRAFFVRLPRGTRTVYYLSQTPWGAADEQVWARLRDAVAK